MKAALLSPNVEQSLDAGNSSKTSSGCQAQVEFLARLRRGDEAAYEMLVREYGGRMLAVARRVLCHEEDARDAVQEAFLQAFRSIERFRGDSNLGTWLHRIVTNAALMKLRSTIRHQVSIEELLPQFDETGHHTQPVRQWSDSPSSDLLREESRAQVRECIDRLPAQYREILILRDIEELDTDETARVLGIGSGSVKTRLHRARQALRTLLEPVFASAASPRTRSSDSAGQMSGPVDPRERTRRLQTVPSKPKS
jgi:RNA polymerase sigma-70 factor (ECF subfamily)